MNALIQRFLLLSCDGLGLRGFDRHIGNDGAPYLLGILPSFSDSLFLLLSVTIVRLGQMNLLD